MEDVTVFIVDSRPLVRTVLMRAFRGHRALAAVSAGGLDRPICSNDVLIVGDVVEPAEGWPAARRVRVGRYDSVAELVASVVRPSAVEQPTSRGSTTARPAVELTPREHEVLCAVASGMGAEEIGSALGLRPKSVQNHKQRIYAKLGARSQAHAVDVALAAGSLRLADVDPGAPSQ